jgi:2-hydroxychromene-2-carboxylate isomerase
MNERLYTGQDNREWGSGGPEDVRVFARYAQELALDSTALSACMEAHRHTDQIEADLRDAATRGLNSTPSFLVNGQVLLGARPFNSWKQLFDSILEKP